MTDTLCPLCRRDADDPLWKDAHCRVLLTPQPGYPGFCRVIWHDHVGEMTDLSEAQRGHLMAVVWGVEAALRELLRPAKINLASLGNQVPHLHWHVIPRFDDDAHFPDAVWARPRREGVAHPVDRKALMRALQRRLLIRG
ncbi:MAG: HIT family protein [Gammaproteobacteria bacterium]|jgi:diadenosine tetraphosphate (Ap4A) HIT family hydrolase